MVLLWYYRPWYLVISIYLCNKIYGYFLSTWTLKTKIDIWIVKKWRSRTQTVYCLIKDYMLYQPLTVQRWRVWIRCYLGSSEDINFTLVWKFDSQTSYLLIIMYLKNEIYKHNLEYVIKLLHMNGHCFCHCIIYVFIVPFHASNCVFCINPLQFHSSIYMQRFSVLFNLLLVIQCIFKNM